MNTMEITDGRWRALARSSPWRWRSVHLTWHHALDDEDAEAGADVFVAGSAVYGAESAAAAVDELREMAERHSH